MKTAFALIACVLAVALVLRATPAEAGKGEGYAKVEARESSQTGIVAIGGETTGTIIQTKDVTLELDLSKDKKLAETAESLNGKTGVVTGALTIRKGVTRGPRIVIVVESLKAAE